MTRDGEANCPQGEYLPQIPASRLERIPDLERGFIDGIEDVIAIL